MRLIRCFTLVSAFSAALMLPLAAGAQTRTFDGPRLGNPTPRGGATIAGAKNKAVTERRGTPRATTPTRGNATGKGIANKGTKGCDVC